VDGLGKITYYGTMTGFLLKKNFYDLWDNMFRIVLINLGFIISLAVPVFLPGLIPIEPLSIAVFAAGIIWSFIYFSAAALSVKAISDYGAFGFADFGRNLKEGWKAGLILGLLSVLFYIMVTIIIPFYLSMGSPVGLLLAAVIFWTLVISVLSFQFFFAIRARLDTKPLKIIKKCFIIFFDNPGFSIFVLINVIIITVLSAFLAFLIPGPAGVLLFLDQAVRLRLMKYDWLEDNPDTDPVPSRKKRKIPWDAILNEEKEKTGDRTFRNFIFPWKY